MIFTLNGTKYTNVTTVIFFPKNNVMMSQDIGHL